MKLIKDAIVVATLFAICSCGGAKINDNPSVTEYSVYVFGALNDSRVSISLNDRLVSSGNLSSEAESGWAFYLPLHAASTDVLHIAVGKDTDKAVKYSLDLSKAAGRNILILYQDGRIDIRTQASEPIVY